RAPSPQLLCVRRLPAAQCRRRLFAGPDLSSGPLPRNRSRSQRPVRDHPRSLFRATLASGHRPPCVPPKPCATWSGWPSRPATPLRCVPGSEGRQAMKRFSWAGLFGAATLSFALTGAALAQSSVKIGAIYPLSGVAATAGLNGKAAIEIALDIINNAHPELGDLPLAKNAGLAGLGGAKVEVVFADNQGTPAAGQNQAVRLITEEKVVALNGAYQSGITLTASAAAERYGIPFLSGDSVAANLTERGFKWFFRTTPIATDFARIYMEFLKDMKGRGAKVDSIAIVHENTEYGTSVASVVTSIFKANGLNISLDIPYAANSTDVQSQVLQLKDKKP